MYILCTLIHICINTRTSLSPRQNKMKTKTSTYNAKQREISLIECVGWYFVIGPVTSRLGCDPEPTRSRFPPEYSVSVAFPLSLIVWISHSVTHSRSANLHYATFAPIMTNMRHALLPKLINKPQFTNRCEQLGPFHARFAFFVGAKPCKNKLIKGSSIVTIIPSVRRLISLW